jgi:hypothetical protein
VAELIVGLDSSVIQDGNYGEFVRGTTAPFALEFRAFVPIRERVRFDKKGPSLVHVLEDAYEIIGQVMHVARDWWVLDVGLLLCSYESPPKDLSVGTWVCGGLVGIEIDSGSYFEDFAHESGAPALIYDWKIEKIEEQEPDPEKLDWKEVAKTRSQADERRYLLHCERLDGPRRPKSRNHP